MVVAEVLMMIDRSIFWLVGNINDKTAVVTITAKRKNNSSLPNFIRMFFIKALHSKSNEHKVVCLTAKANTIFKPPRCGGAESLPAGKKEIQYNSGV
jgi:hypothetical protein